MKSALQDGAHLLLYAPLSQATAGMAGKKKEGVLRAYRMTWNGMDLWQAYQACEKRGLDVGSWGNVQRGWPGCR